MMSYNMSTLLVSNIVLHLGALAGVRSHVAALGAGIRH